MTRPHGRDQERAIRLAPALDIAALLAGPRGAVLCEPRCRSATQPDDARLPFRVRIATDAELRELRHAAVLSS